MIDRKEISKASAAHAKATWNNDEEQFACMDGFEAGADWAIDEFLQNLWHDASEEPQAERHILEKIDFIGIRYRTDSFYVGMDWKKRVKRYDIVSWCYLSDIMPQEGGKP